MSKRSEIPDFPDVNEIARLLIQQNKVSLDDVGLLKNNPEFQVFRIIGENKLLTTEQIEQKYKTNQSLSMILSNLQADNMISQTSDYQWKIHQSIWDLLKEVKEIKKDKSEKEPSEEEKLLKQKQLSIKKNVYKRIADELVGTTYVPTNYTIEDLFQIPELEILAIIYETGTISTDRIEDRSTLDTSVSLALSNLQADGFIEQNEQYEWELSEKLSTELTHKSQEIQSEDSVKQDQQMGMPINQSQAKIIEHKQLIKAIMDIDYFPNKTINEILETPEFEILNIINSHSPITSDEIEEKLQHETLLSLQLSNLSADDLIIQTNDIRWVLAEEFRARVSKVKVDQEEIMKQLKQEEKNSLSKQSNSEIDNIEKDERLPEKEQTDDEETIPSDIKSPSELEITSDQNPLLSTLVDRGYITDPNVSEAELLGIPEYEIMRLLVVDQPLSSDEIDQRSNTSSVSLTLSNLAADGLIHQKEADFKYELTAEFQHLASTSSRMVKEKVTVEDSSQKMQDKELDEKEFDEQKEEIQKSRDKVNDVDLRNLKSAAMKAGYIENENANTEDLMKISEFEVLKIIGNYQPIDDQKIKDEAESVSPVLISRTLSKLEAEDRIEKVEERLWKYTSNFEQLLIEDELKEKERLEKLKAEKEEKERIARQKAVKERREKFITLLKQEGVIDESQPHKKLMEIPEFEILWIIADAAEGITEEEIKDKAVSTSPVLVSRTISQLETKGRIQRTLKNTYELSSDLKSKT